MSEPDAVERTKADPNRSRREDQLVAEIEALRRELNRVTASRFRDAMATIAAFGIRAEALEEAAYVCDQLAARAHEYANIEDEGERAFAEAAESIRALKDKP